MGMSNGHEVKSWICGFSFGEKKIENNRMRILEKNWSKNEIEEKIEIKNSLTLTIKILDSLKYNFYQKQPKTCAKNLPPNSIKNLTHQKLSKISSYQKSSNSDPKTFLQFFTCQKPLSSPKVFILKIIKIGTLPETQKNLLLKNI